ncbi:MAG: hypothetical protein COB35_09825 [Gammaproteobacteria bacterium]|nr:MAG: hypothetical protein COB35_09825 [Gammaproteobacteria bacterium]
MNNITHHKLKQLAHQRSLWILVLSIWLFFVNVSIVHAQQHKLGKGFSTNYQCQLCLTNFNHTPFILSDSVIVTPVTQASITIAQNAHGIIRVHQLTTFNRGPPNK